MAKDAGITIAGMAIFTVKPAMTQIDPRTIQALDEWIDEKLFIENDAAFRARVRSEMIALISDNIEYWITQNWWDIAWYAARTKRGHLES
jgi:hypothetical protein